VATDAVPRLGPDEDAEAFIWSANGKRRHMTKGQLAMIAAVGVSLETKKTSGAAGGRPDEGKAKAARSAGVSAARVSQALTVKEHAPHLVADVISSHSLWMPVAASYAAHGLCRHVAKCILLL
jgi:hypothetical protein